MQQQFEDTQSEIELGIDVTGPEDFQKAETPGSDQITAEILEEKILKERGKNSILAIFNNI